MKLVTLAVALLAFAQVAQANPQREVRRKLAAVAQLEADRSLGGQRLADFAQDPIASVRQAALRALGRLQVKAARNALVKGLTNPVPGVRTEAAFALGQLPGEGVESLAKALAKEKDARVRVVLAEAIGKQAGPGDGAALLAVGSDTSLDLRVAARTGLGLIAKRNKGVVEGVDEAVVAKWLEDEDSDGRYAAAYLLMRAKSLRGAAAFEAAGKCAGDGAPTVRALCVRALGDFGAKALDALNTSAEDDDWRVGVQAVRGLGTLKAAEALGLWLEGRAEQPVVTPGAHAFIAGLDAALELASSPALQKVGVLIYNKVKTSGTIAADPAQLARSHVRCRAAALADLRRGRPDKLRRCGASDYPKASHEALQVKVLARSGKPAAQATSLTRFYPKATAQGKVAVLEKLAALAKEKGVSKLVLTAAADTDPAIVATAAEAAAKMKLGAADRVLLKSYKRFMAAKEWETVQAIFKAFGELKSEAASEVLEEHTFHPNHAVAAAATAALKKVRNQDARRMARMPEPPPLGAGTPNLALATDSPYRWATLVTTRGPIKLELFVKDARATVKNFVRLTKKGYYDNLPFHRVVSDFVAQGGDPRGDGWGGPGYAIRCEINRKPYRTGAVGMALAGKDTGGSQFFITHSPQPHLDGGYTVFAQVSAGQEVADQLLVGDRILKIELHEQKP